MILPTIGIRHCTRLRNYNSVNAHVDQGGTATKYLAQLIPQQTVRIMRVIIACHGNDEEPENPQLHDGPQEQARPYQ